MSAPLHRLVAEYDVVLHDDLLPALGQQGFRVFDRPALDELDGSELRSMVLRSLHPLLTPMTVDATHPFPRVGARGINLGVRVREPSGRRNRFVCIPVPAVLPRCLDLGDGRFVPVESAVCALLPDVLSGLQVVELSCFRVTRSENGERALLGGGVPHLPRALGRVVRLEVEHSTSPLLLDVLTANLNVGPDDVCRVRTSLAMGPALAQFGGDLGVEQHMMPSEVRR